MPPKAPAIPEKEEGTKRVKDLELLLACVKSATAFEVNFEELKKLDDAPTDGALRKRVQRMNQNLGLSAKSTPVKVKPAANDETNKARLATKKARTKKKPRGSDEDEADTKESPLKKSKTEQVIKDVKHEDDPDVVEDEEDN